MLHCIIISCNPMHFIPYHNFLRPYNLKQHTITSYQITSFRHSIAPAAAEVALDELLLVGGDLAVVEVHRHRPQPLLARVLHPRNLPHQNCRFQYAPKLLINAPKLLSSPLLFHLHTKMCPRRLSHDVKRISFGLSDDGRWTALNHSL